MKRILLLSLLTASVVAQVPLPVKVNSSGAIVDPISAATFRSANGIAPLASPALTGVPTAPTASGGTNNGQIATTQFVASAVGAIDLSSKISKDGSISFTGDQSMGSHKLTSLADGTASGDAINLGQANAAYATSAQGTIADTAVQPDSSPDFGSVGISGHDISINSGAFHFETGSGGVVETGEFQELGGGFIGSQGDTISNGTSGQFSLGAAGILSTGEGIFDTGLSTSGAVNAAVARVASSAVTIGEDTGSFAFISSDGSAKFAAGGVIISNDGIATFYSTINALGGFSVDGTSIQYASGTFNVDSSGTVTGHELHTIGDLISIGTDTGTSAYINTDGSASFLEGGFILASDNSVTATGNIFGNSITVGTGATALNSDGTASFDSGGVLINDGGNMQVAVTLTAGEVLTDNIGINLGNSVSMEAPLKLKSYTVSTLPAASTAGEGATAFVTDALAPSFLATVSGGGSTKTPVVSDGTSWKTY